MGKQPFSFIKVSAVNENISKSTQKESQPHGQKETEDLIQRVLAITVNLCAELFPHSTAPVALDSDFIQDLGLDSIARVELFSRLEDSCGVVLPEEVLATTRTPRDLFQATLCRNRARYPAQPNLRSYAAERRY